MTDRIITFTVDTSSAQRSLEGLIARMPSACSVEALTAGAEPCQYCGRGRSFDVTCRGCGAPATPSRAVVVKSNRPPLNPLKVRSTPVNPCGRLMS
jgi:hypothetical protein